jgi:hypothetical protein
VTAIAEYFEIFDDTISTKKFRLRQLPGASGDILLESETNFPDVASVTNAIDTAIQNGIFSEKLYNRFACFRSFCNYPS